MIQIGTKVVCMGDFSCYLENDSIKKSFRLKGLPQKNKTYVVREVEDAFDIITNKRTVSIKLVGLIIVCLSQKRETGWNAADFKELDELKEQNKKNQIETVKVKVESKVEEEFDGFNPS